MNCGGILVNLGFTGFLEVTGLLGFPKKSISKYPVDLAFVDIKGGSSTETKASAHLTAEHTINIQQRVVYEALSHPVRVN